MSALDRQCRSGAEPRPRRVVLCGRVFLVSVLGIPVEGEGALVVSTVVASPPAPD